MSAKQHWFYETKLPPVNSSHLPQVSMMASTYREPKQRDGVLSTLDVFIQALNLAKDTCGIPPAQVAFGSACALLTMIRVCFPILYEDGLVINVYLGHDGQRSGVRRAWTGLRRCMPNALPEVEGETVRWSQPVRSRCDWRSDYVSRT